MNSFNLSNLIQSLFVFVVSILMASCFGSDKIPENDMVKIYTDIIIVQDTLKLTGNKLLSEKKAILKKYNYTEQQYESTIEYYNEDVERWESFFEKTLSYLETLKKQESH